MSVVVPKEITELLKKQDVLEAEQNRLYNLISENNEKFEALEKEDPEVADYEYMHWVARDKELQKRLYDVQKELKILFPKSNFEFIPCDYYEGGCK